MHALKIRLLATLFALGPAIALAADPVPAPLTIGLDRIGPLKVGMSVTEAARVLKHELVVDGAFAAECHYVVPKPPIEGLAFMVSKDRIVRIDVESSAIRTRSGVTIGDSEPKVLKALGKGAEVAQHKYGGTGDHYLTLRTRDRKHAIRFETFEGQVTHLYAGLTEFVERADGCF